MLDNILWGPKFEGEICVQLLDGVTGEVISRTTLPLNATRADAEEALLKYADRPTTKQFSHIGELAPEK